MKKIIEESEVTRRQQAIQALSVPQQDLLQAIIEGSPWPGGRGKWKVFDALLERELITRIAVDGSGHYVRYVPSHSVEYLFWTIFPERHKVGV